MFFPAVTAIRECGPRKSTGIFSVYRFLGYEQVTVFRRGTSPSVGVRQDGHVMGIRLDGSLGAWGRNMEGQIGDGTTIDWHSPVIIVADVVE